jgi:transposase
VRSFATTTSALFELLAWLEQHGCTHVVMEATGVYWKPVWHVLEGSFELVLANAQHVRNVPGRKSDVNDAMWLADLLAHGLVQGSFVPPSPIQEVRDLTRTRKQLAREIIQHQNRIEKILEDANIKIGSAISDTLGRSGRAILDALVAGETDPAKLVALCSDRLKASRKSLIEALRGRVTDHHRFLLKLHLTQVDQHRSRRIRKGAPWLKTTLVSAAWAAVKTKGTYLQAQFQRLRARRGAKKAIIAVAASMLTAAYHILRDSVPYKDLGPEHFTRRDKKHAARRLQRRLEDLGFAVEIRPTTSGVSI